jgi:hypothetical protein
MQQFSPVKIIAGIVAIGLAVAGLFFATKLREGAATMFSAARANTAKRAPTAPPANDTYKPSGRGAVPIGVVSAPGSAPAAGPAAASSPRH